MCLSIFFNTLIYGIHGLSPVSCADNPGEAVRNRTQGNPTVTSGGSSSQPDWADALALGRNLVLPINHTPSYSCSLPFLFTAGTSARLLSRLSYQAELRPTLRAVNCVPRPCVHHVQLPLYFSRLAFFGCAFPTCSCLRNLDRSLACGYKRI